MTVEPWVLAAVAAGLAAAGAVVGGAAAWLVADRRCRRATDALRAEVGDAGRRHALAEQRAEDLQDRNDVLLAQVNELQEERAVLSGDKRTAEVRLEAARENLREQKDLLAEARQKLSDAFAGLSRDALRSNTDAFLDLARSHFESLREAASGDLSKRQAAIDGLVAPLRETLDLYQKRLCEIEHARTATYGDIREQLAGVAAVNGRLDVQTGQLVQALANPGTRGRWGELQLRRLMELSGLNAHFDFEEQASLTADDGARQRPDLVVRLPGGRNVVVDSKYAADDFLKACDCPDPEQKRRHLCDFARAVRRHAQQLGQKRYQSQLPWSCDFVVLFLPGESLIYAAAEHDPDLIEDAFKRDVIIATPTTLVALLKTVAQGWQDVEMEKNIEVVKHLGGQMIDRVATFAEHFVKVGAALDTATQSYNNAAGSMEKNLYTTTRRMAELGTPGKKELPEPKRVDAAARKLQPVEWPAD